VLSSDYLQGKWSENAKQGCTSDHTGYVIFHNNRTWRHAKTVSAAGFWELGEGTVTLRLLVSPAGGGGGIPFIRKGTIISTCLPKCLA